MPKSIGTLLYEMFQLHSIFYNCFPHINVLPVGVIVVGVRVLAGVRMLQLF